MDCKILQQKFQSIWGAIGTSWGVNRTMVQIHALLLVAENPLSTEDIMEELCISRGNANVNIRALIDWGLVYRQIKSGERREFFSAEKDITKVFRVIVRERRKRELEPMISALRELKESTAQNSDTQGTTFAQMINDIENFASKVDSVLSIVEKSDKPWINASLSLLLRDK